MDSFKLEPAGFDIPADTALPVISVDGLSNVLTQLESLNGTVSSILTTTDAILVDMVGEVTFLAAIAELNAAIAALSVDIDAAITTSTATIVASIAAATTTLGTLLTTIYNTILMTNTKIDTLNSNVTTSNSLLSSIGTKLDTLNASVLAGNAISSDIYTRLGFINSGVSTIATNTNAINQNMTDLNGDSVFKASTQRDGLGPVESVFKADHEWTGARQSVFACERGSGGDYPVTETRYSVFKWPQNWVDSTSSSVFRQEYGPAPPASMFQGQSGISVGDAADKIVLSTNPTTGVAIRVYT